MRNRHIQCHLVNHLWIIVTPSRKGMMLGSETERGLLKENIGRSKLLEVSKPEVFRKKTRFFCCISLFTMLSMLKWFTFESLSMSASRGSIQFLISELLLDLFSLGYDSFDLSNAASVNRSNVPVWDFCFKNLFRFSPLSCWMFADVVVFLVIFKIGF